MGPDTPTVSVFGSIGSSSSTTFLPSVESRSISDGVAMTPSPPRLRPTTDEPKAAIQAPSPIERSKDRLDGFLNALTAVDPVVRRRHEDVDSASPRPASLEPLDGDISSVPHYVGSVEVLRIAYIERTDLDVHDEPS